MLQDSWKFSESVLIVLKGSKSFGTNIQELQVMTLGRTLLETPKIAGNGNQVP